MILYLLIAAVTIVLASGIRPIAYEVGTYPVSRQRQLNRVLVLFIFAILTLLAALRIEVGNDYGTYVVTCHEIFQHGYVVTEPGYNLVVRILYTLSGKEDYILMFAVFAAAIAAIFLKAIKDQSLSFSLSFFIFMMMGLYFNSFNTVRYYFALGVAIYSLKYVICMTDDSGRFIWENLFKFLILILFAASFHKSVLITIPIYLFSRLKWNNIIYVIVAVCAVIPVIFRKYIMDIALRLYPSYRDTVYVENAHSIMENWTALTGCILVFVLCLFFYKEAIEGREDNRLYFHLNIFAIIIYVSLSFLPLITRFAYYCIAPEIFLIPNVICLIDDDDKKRRIKLVVIVFCVLYFLYYLHTADREGIRVLPYKSWLFYDRYWLNQTDTF